MHAHALATQLLRLMYPFDDKFSLIHHDYCPEQFVRSRRGDIEPWSAEFRALQVPGAAY
jgi:hypothetical protein